MFFILVSLTSSSRMYLFQYQCVFHALSPISSMGIPFVSGNKKMTNKAMINIHAAKKKKIPARRWHIIDKKACAMMKVNNMLDTTAKAKPTVLVSRGKISLGINHPRGPHDHAKFATYTHTSITTQIAVPCPREFVAFRCTCRIDPIAVYNICISSTSVHVNWITT